MGSIVSSEVPWLQVVLFLPWCIVNEMEWSLSKPSHSRVCRIPFARADFYRNRCGSDFGFLLGYANRIGTKSFASIRTSLSPSSPGICRIISNRFFLLYTKLATTMGAQTHMWNRTARIRHDHLEVGTDIYSVVCYAYSFGVCFWIHEHSPTIV